MDYTLQDLEKATLHWLLTLEVRGTVYRFATQDLDLVDDDGLPRVYVGTLEPLEYEDRSGVFEDQVSDRYAVLTFRFVNGASGDAQGITQRAETDHEIADCRAEVALIRDGDSFDARQVLLSGWVDLQHGAPGDPVQVTVRSSPLLDRSLFPDAAARVNSTTWPATAFEEFDPQIADVYYPVPFGEPGKVDSVVTEAYGSPALLVRIDLGKTNATRDAWVLVADREIAATEVLIQNKSTSTSATLPVEVETDGLGRRVSIVKVGAGDLAVTTGDELWASFRQSNQSGVPSLRGESTRGMGDLVRWLLGLTTLEIDTQRMRGLLDGLNDWRADCYLMPSGQQSAYQWLVSDVLPLLPISPAAGPGGLYFFRWELDPEPADLLHIDLDAVGGEVASEVVYSPLEEVANEFTIEYGYSAALGEYTRRLTLAPEDYGDGWTETDPICAASFTHYQAPGRRALQAAPIQTQVVQDPATALAILRERAKWYAGRRRTVQVLLPQRFQAVLYPGRNIRVSRTRHHWTEVVAMVTSVVRGPGSCMVTLVRPNDWIRDALRTPG